MLINGLASPLFSPAAPAAETANFDCLIEPHMVVDLSSRVDGIIDAILVNRGDRVARNQIVAKLESSVEQAAVDYAQARSQMNAEIQQLETIYAYGLRNQDRITDLHAKQAVPISEIDRIQTDTSIAKFKLAQAKENRLLAELDLIRAKQTLKQHTITSPIHGVVMERYLNPGESVEDRPIVKVAQIDPLRVEVVMPVAYFGKLNQGQTGLVYPEADIGGEFPATVTTLDSVLDAASGTFRVSLRLANSDHKLTGGLKCNIEFDL